MIELPKSSRFCPRDDSLVTVEVGGLTVAPCILGVVGSMAYGLTREGSDLDIGGVFVYPTESLLGLHTPPDSVGGVSSEEDFRLHEVGKAIRLLLKANPSVLELLYLDEYLQVTEDGQSLIDLRESFLATPKVRLAYGGYAVSQLRALQKLGDRFSSKTAGRTEKHARHVLRLVEQGTSLLTTGTMSVKVAEPGRLFELAALVKSDPERFCSLAEQRISKLDTAHSVLPETTDDAQIEKFLLGVRRRHYAG